MRDGDRQWHTRTPAAAGRGAQRPRKMVRNNETAFSCVTETSSVPLVTHRGVSGNIYAANQLVQVLQVFVVVLLVEEMLAILSP